jgi:uncharacterized protein YecE (DUF72 family)
VVDKRLGESAWLAGDAYSIADIATFPWINNLIKFYGAGELVGIDAFANVRRVLAAFLERPAVVRAMNIPARPALTSTLPLPRAGEGRGEGSLPGTTPAAPRMVERARGEVRIGISGWRYPPWRGVFYPPGLAQRRELEFASRTLPTIEINGSFYSLQRPESWAEWHDQTPEGFVFAVKGSRYITHMLKLNGVEAALANFLASGLFRLKAKLGPILWQFPPQLGFDAARFDAFFTLLPRDTAAALALARRHDSRLAGRSVLEIDAIRPLRHAVEIRHPSFVDPAFVALLRRHRIALVVADTAGRWPLLEDLTPTSSTCACTATRSSTPAATATPRSTAGPGAWARGGAARRSRMRAWPRRSRRRRGPGATCIATSTTTSRSMRRTTQHASRSGSACRPDSWRANGSCRRRGWSRLARARRRFAGRGRPRRRPPAPGVAEATPETGR